MKKYAFAIIGPLCFLTAHAQLDKAVYIDYVPSYYWTTIVPSVNDFDAGEYGGHDKVFTVDLSDMDLPTTPSEYTQAWHGSVISQGNTSTCWCFATTSFYESEVYRINGKEVKLSEMYTVYWEYVERARYFVANRGDMYFGEGSETNAVARMMSMYGIVPWELYTGYKDGQEFHSTDQMQDELRSYLNSVKERDAWNEEEVIATVKSILNFHMGTPPESFEVDGKEYTPLTYLNDYLELKTDEYVNFMSLMEAEYWSMAEYDVPDNWWNSDQYYNVPLEDFMGAIKQGIKDGYTISIGGDVSEPGFNKTPNVAVIPAFDIPSDDISDAARQLRFMNGSTTDDHAMHLVGYQEVDGDTWFLVKDSGSGSRTCGEDQEQFGYYFFHEDYVALKMMSITIHQDAVKALLKKMKA